MSCCAIFSAKKLGLEGPMSLCWVHVGLMSGLYWAMLGLILGLDWAILGLSWAVRKRWGAIFGILFFRAKNHAIFSLKKLAYGRASCRALYWAHVGPYLGPWLSLSGSISGPTIGCEKDMQLGGKFALSFFESWLLVSFIGVGLNRGLL